MKPTTIEANQSESVRQRLKEDLYNRFSPAGLGRKRRRKIFQNLAWILFVQSISAARRALDMAVAYTLFRLFLPVIALTFLILRVKGGVAIKRTRKVGRYCELFDELSFAAPDTRIGRIITRFNIHRLPVLINIFRGQMAFVGPRAVTPEELSNRERAARRRCDVRPGLICFWWIRQRANIDYGSELEADSEYVDSHSLSGDLSLALRAIPAAVYGKAMVAATDMVSILDIEIDNITMTESIEEILKLLGNHVNSQICFVNADCANLAHKDGEYRRVLNMASLTLADGIGMKLAGKLLAREIRQNVNGTDLFPRLCEALSGTGKSIYLLGAAPGVAESVADWVRSEYPDVSISGTQHGYFSKEEEETVIEHIRSSEASLLLVALGAPRQDLWIARNLASTGVNVAMGVGGLFDFYSGRVNRAPRWLREMGLEWLYRFYQEPRRMWRRYFVGNAVFLGRVLKERLKGKQEAG